MDRYRSAILIVDDEPDVCWALEHILVAEGLCVEKAATGREAVDLIESTPFRLIFLDAKLPDADGCKLARRIRTLAPATTIIIVSGYYYPDDPLIRQAVAEGVIHGFIGKPFVHSEVTKLLQPEGVQKAVGGGS